jgi:hypothetical protein
MKTPLPEPLLEEDPVLVESVDRALAKYKGVLSPHMFEAFRREALLQLSANPKAIALATALRPRAVKATTGDEAREGAIRDEEAGSSSGSSSGGSSSGSDPRGPRRQR